MTQTIEVHIIQSVPPSGINRDHKGIPKFAMYGGTDRDRLSSQSQKRRQRNLTDTLRTRVPHELIKRELARRGEDPQPWTAAVREVMGEKYDGYDGERLKIMALLCQDEIALYADLLLARPALRDLANEVAKLREAGKDEAKALKPKAAELAAAVNELLRQFTPQMSPDLALYGRFIAHDDTQLVEAATSYSHAISVGRRHLQADDFVAMDDYEQQGAHLGQSALTAPTFYRFATLDLDQLERNLPGRDLTGIVRDWVKGFCYALPNGGQHGAFAQTLPEFVMIVRRDGGHAVTLANAFVNAATAHDGLNQLEDAVLKLQAQFAYNQRAFESNGLVQAVQVSRDAFPAPAGAAAIERHDTLVAALERLGQ